MEDVGRAPAEVSPVLNFEPTTIPTLDGWIESLMSCKQLAEADVQRLCDKVSRLPIKWDATEPSLNALCI
jgi:serine/threonine-protein phosphatase 2A catalytic subunit